MTVWTDVTFKAGTIRGMGINDPNATDMAAFKATGANIGRIFCELNRTPNGYAIPSETLTVLDRAVSQAASRAFKLVIVFEPMPNQFEQDYWDNTTLQDSIASNWATIAARYKGNQAIAGFDLINEPIADKVNVFSPEGHQTWFAFANKLINAIRAVDPSRLIFFEPSGGGLPQAFDFVFMTFSQPNIVYSAHVYEPHEYSHQGLYDYYDRPTYPGIWSKSDLLGHLQPVRNFVARTGKSIYVGEFSAVRWAAGAGAYIRDLMNAFEAERWAWSYHAWREFPGWDPEIPTAWFNNFPVGGGQYPLNDAAPNYPDSQAASQRTNTAFLQQMKDQFVKNRP